MRNVRCPSYSKCLDQAVDAGLSDFDCSACAHRYDQDTITPLEVARAIAFIVLVATGTRMDPATIDIDALMRTARPWREFAPTLGMDRAEIV